MTNDMTTLAARVIAAAYEERLTIATAESCTGGLIAGALTDVPGSSAVFDRGYVTYSNEAKTEMLGVPTSLIIQHGAVSSQVARAMAEGALASCATDIAVSVTGIAGPGGGSAEKPVGLVYIGVQRRGAISAAKRFDFAETHGADSRTKVREATVIEALNCLLDLAS